MNAVETLRIKNFAGIKDAQIELSRMNVFIGPQASGKSVCAKLLFYFKEIIRRTFVEADEDKSMSQMQVEHQHLFLRYFPPSAWGESMFEIEYAFNELSIVIERKADTINMAYSNAYVAFLGTLRKVIHKHINSNNSEGGVSAAFPIIFLNKGGMLTQRFGSILDNENYFIPAGRSYFSSLELSVFSLIASDVKIDPFLSEFGQRYMNARRAYSFRSEEQKEARVLGSFMGRLVCGTYKRIRERDYILTDDERQVPVENSSSGQQEVLPLILVVSEIAEDEKRAGRSTLFVEEPEAHLYPTAQREIVHLLAAVTDLASDETSGQYVITTHSPYILSALNNLMYGAQLAAQSADKRSRVAQVLGDAALVPAENVRAYAFGDGQVQSIIDPETHLVRATVLDSVSNELAKEFGDLLDIEFEDEELAA